METYELENAVRAAFVDSEELMAVVPNGEKGIYHYVAPSTAPSRYPIIVYSPISDVPAVSGDNREIAHRVTIRIHVIASQKKFAVEEQNFLTACKQVKAIMASLGFVRRQTTPFVDDGKTMMIFDFIKGVQS